MSRRPRTTALLAATLVMLSFAVGVEVARERLYAASPAVGEELVYVRSGGAMRRIALSYDALLADVYWIRALQHYGGSRLHPDAAHRFGLLYPYLDLTTSLDPHFTIAYRFGAIFLAEPFPGGAGRPDLAVKLLEKGIRALPGRWELFQDIGFVYYWNLHDYRTAAAWFTRGGDLPGSPWWLRTWAAAMLTRGGDRDTSRAIWRSIGETADNEWLKATAELRLKQLDALDEIALLQRKVNEYGARHGRPPETWPEMIAAGALSAVPIDPAGTPYDLNFATGRVALSGWSALYPLPAAAAGAAPAEPGAPR